MNEFSFFVAMVPFFNFLCPQKRYNVLKITLLESMQSGENAEEILVIGNSQKQFLLPSILHKSKQNSAVECVK